MDIIPICLLSVMEWLNKLDHELFTFVNATASFPPIDWLMLSLRNPNTWIPLYAFLLYWLIRYHRKYLWQFVLLNLIVFAITDFTSSAILKPFFGRIRPCYDEQLQSVMRHVIGCGGKLSMPSSHASNHFGLASYWYFSIMWMTNRKWWWLWIWAFLICYAQVYVGKHFPFDIVVGALLGTSVGLVFAALLRKWVLTKRENN